MSYGVGGLAPGIYESSKKLIEDARRSVAASIFNELDGVLNILFDRFKQILDSLDCECDPYNGFTCTLHKDKEYYTRTRDGYFRIKKKHVGVQTPTTKGEDID